MDSDGSLEGEYKPVEHTVFWKMKNYIKSSWTTVLFFLIAAGLGTLSLIQSSDETGQKLEELESWRWSFLAMALFLCPVIAKTIILFLIELLLILSRCSGEKLFLSEVLYYSYALRRSLVRLLYMIFYFVCWISMTRLFNETSPSYNELVERTLVILILYSAGILLADAMTLRISKNFSTYNFELKLKNTIAQELTLHLVTRQLPVAIERSFIKKAVSKHSGKRLVTGNASASSSEIDLEANLQKDNANSNKRSRREIEELAEYIQQTSILEKFKTIVQLQGHRDLGEGIQVAKVISHSVFNAIYRCKPDRKKNAEAKSAEAKRARKVNFVKFGTSKSKAKAPATESQVREQAIDPEVSKPRSASNTSSISSTSNPLPVNIVEPEDSAVVKMDVAELNGIYQTRRTSSSDLRTVAFADFEAFWNERVLTSSVSSLARLVTPEKAWETMNPSNIQSITSMNMHRSIQDMFDERDNLAKTLHSASAVIYSLRRILRVLISVIFVFPALAIFQVAFVESLVGITSILFAFTFVFGNMAKVVFEGIIFLFFVHAYDVGDMLMIKFGADESRYRVAEIHLLTTRFERWDGASIRIDNHKLSSEALITNLSTSNHFGKTHKVALDAQCVNPTFMAQIRKLMTEFVEAHPDKYSKVSITVREIEAPFKAILHCYLLHTYPDVESSRTIKDYAEAVEYLINSMLKLGATYSGVPKGRLPVIMDED